MSSQEEADARKSRLAAELRANIAKRKAQARSRSAQDNGREKDAGVGDPAGSQKLDGRQE